MREIKFRGQRQSDNEWIYGDLLQPTELCDIYEISDCESIDGLRYDVIKHTIGQYTGLHDKNGKEIYEGDIVKIEYADFKFKGVVKYDETYLAYVITNTYTATHEYENLGDYIDYGIEVIGNKFDNPELLEKEGE